MRYIQGETVPTVYLSIELRRILIIVLNFSEFKSCDNMIPVVSMLEYFII